MIPRFPAQICHQESFCAKKKHFSFASAFYSFHFVQIKFQCIYHFSSASTQLGDAKEKVVPRFQCGAPVLASANFAPVSHQLIEHLSKFTHRYFSSSQTRYKNIIKVTFFSNQVITYERLFLFFAPSISFSGGQHVPKYEDKQDQILYRDISFLLETQTIPYKRPPWPKNLTSKIQYVQYWTSIGKHGWDKIVNSFSIRPPWAMVSSPQRETVSHKKQFSTLEIDHPCTVAVIPILDLIWILTGTNPKSCFVISVLSSLRSPHNCPPWPQRIYSSKFGV